MKLALISDVHGNLPALESVLSEIERYGVDQIVSLGDVTGYYSQPNECINLLKERKAIQLLGNHDQYLISGQGCPRSRVVSNLLSHQEKDISKKNMDYLSNLIPNINIENISFVHGGWDDNLEEYLYEITLQKLLGDYKFYFSGHTHVQFMKVYDEKVYCNPGAVGQPRDGDPRSAFCIFDGSNVALHRIGYDIDKTAKAMQLAGFKDAKLWENLYIGSQIGGRIDSTNAF